MKPQICLVPKLDGLGGMVSFQAKFIQGLKEQNIAYTFDISDTNNTAVLVIGGTRHIWQLWRAKSRSVRIVQRLNGMNWLHKVEKTPLPAAFKSELNNQTLAFIRRFLATHIIYQSTFSRDWWHREFREISTPARVVYNGVDLSQYTPQGQGERPDDHFRLLLVEGHLHPCNSRGLETAVRLTQALKHSHSINVEMVVVGDVEDALKAHVYSMAPDLWITWRGIVPRERIPSLDRTAHVLFSADLNAACPNSVIEAMACGLPIVAYDTGALKELVQGGAGEVVPYGANHWRLESPDIAPLANACIKIMQNNAPYRQAARKRAEAAFGLDTMVESYLEVLVP
jgi:glycosyltransferase involved in cell wall biosynthesis